METETGWLQDVLNKIDTLNDDMIGFGKFSNDWSLSTAKLIVSNLQTKPSKIIPMARGGICFTFERNNLTARLEIENNGSVVFASSNAIKPSPEGPYQYCEYKFNSISVKDAPDTIDEIFQKDDV